MYFAQKGQGATCNGQPLAVSKQATLKGSYVSSGIWRGMYYKMPGFMADLVFREGADSFPMGSIVYNAGLLAAGEIEGIIFAATTAHDVAAIKVIVEEAGGKVTDLYGNEQDYDKPIKGAVLSNGLIHNDLLKLVAEHLEV
jgi:fructose-1,6-bisphosphatase/inositol monophosphatase family enzyme